MNRLLLKKCVNKQKNTHMSFGESSNYQYRSLKYKHTLKAWYTLHNRDTKPLYDCATNTNWIKTQLLRHITKQGTC